MKTNYAGSVCVALVATLCANAGAASYVLVYNDGEPMFQPLPSVTAAEINKTKTNGGGQISESDPTNGTLRDQSCTRTWQWTLAPGDDPAVVGTGPQMSVYHRYNWSGGNPTASYAATGGGKGQVTFQSILVDTYTHASSDTGTWPFTAQAYRQCPYPASATVSTSGSPQSVLASPLNSKIIATITVKISNYANASAFYPGDSGNGHVLASTNATLTGATDHGFDLQ